MTKLTIITALAVLGTLSVVAFLQPERPTEAYRTEKCTHETTLYVLKWPGDSTTYDVTHGNLFDWWQEEIEEAADIWNDDGGADFSFNHSSSSSHDWGKKRLRKIHRIAETGIVATNCVVTDVDTYFNTRYTFNRCDTDPGDCNQSDVYDVRAVSLHEFGHWLVLGHTAPWRFSCVMRNGEWEDRTLCGDDRNGIQSIYGED